MIEEIITSVFMAMSPVVNAVLFNLSFYKNTSNKKLIISGSLILFVMFFTSTIPDSMGLSEFFFVLAYIFQYIFYLVSIFSIVIIHAIFSKYSSKHTKNFFPFFISANTILFMSIIFYELIIKIISDSIITQIISIIYVGFNFYISLIFYKMSSTMEDAVVSKKLLKVFWCVIIYGFTSAVLLGLGLVASKYGYL